MALVFVPPFKLAASDSIVPRSSSITKIYGNSAFSLSVGGTAAATGQLDVICGSASTIGQIIKAASSQTADLLQTLDSSSNILLKVGSSGFVNYLASNQTQSTAFNVFDSSSTQTISADIGFALFNCGDTFKFTASQGAFSLQQFFRHVATYKNDTSLTGTTVANHWSYINQPTFTADTNAINVCQFNGSAYRDSAIFNRVNGGTMTVGEWNSFQSIPSSGTGVTITNRRGLIITDCTGGTITNHYGLVINDLANAGGTTTQSMRVLGTTGHCRIVPKMMLGSDAAPTSQLQMGAGTFEEKTNALTYASPTSVDATLGNIHTVTTVNATGSVTFNFAAAPRAGVYKFIITNDGTSGKTITFGTSFKPNGTLVGTTSKTAVVTFVSDGTNAWESGRITGLT